MKYKIGEKVKIIDCGMSGGKWNDRFQDQKDMVGKKYTIKDIKFCYYLMEGGGNWHFGENEIEKTDTICCEKCGHELIDSYEK